MSETCGRSADLEIGKRLEAYCEQQTWEGPSPRDSGFRRLECTRERVRMQESRIGGWLECREECEREGDEFCAVS